LAEIRQNQTIDYATIQSYSKSGSSQPTTSGGRRPNHARYSSNQHPVDQKQMNNYWNMNISDLYKQYTKKAPTV
jgi:hypothetical protein